MHIISGRACAILALLAAAALVAPAQAGEIAHPQTFTVYSGRISSEETWHDVLLKPFSSNYTDSYLVALSYMHAYREHFDGRLRMEYEVNATYNFGEQDHWEVNFAPITLRWQHLPWDHYLHSTIAFGLGFSYAFEYPEVEYRLENDTQQFLMFWQLELTAGPREGPWSAVLRLHHRSPGMGRHGRQRWRHERAVAGIPLRVLSAVLLLGAPCQELRPDESRGPITRNTLSIGLALAVAACGGGGGAAPASAAGESRPGSSALTISDQYAIQFHDVDYDVTQGGRVFVDPDGDALSYDITFGAVPNGLQVNGTRVVGRPQTTGSRSPSRRCAGCRAAALASTFFSIFVAPNGAPRPMTAREDTLVQVGEVFTLDATRGGTRLTDPEGDPLTYMVSIRGSPGVAVNGTQVSGALAAVGAVEVTLQGTDPYGASAQAEFVIAAPGAAPGHRRCRLPRMPTATNRCRCPTISRARANSAFRCGTRNPSAIELPTPGPRWAACCSTTGDCRSRTRWPAPPAISATMASRRRSASAAARSACR